MKINATQLDELTRGIISQALNYWANQNEKSSPVISIKYRQIATRINHGELILCEYQYNEQEKGGEYETGH